MAGHIHAATLLACPIVTILILWRARRRRPSDRELLCIFAVTAVVLIVAAFLFTCDICGLPKALAQWMAPGFCLFFLMAYPANAKVRLIASCGMLIAMFALPLSYDALISTPEWTGAPYSDSQERIRLAAARGIFVDVANAPELRKERYDACWLRELPVWPAMEQMARNDRRGEFINDPKCQVAIPQWHSGFTNLCGAVTVPADFWYMGGPIMFGEIELRPVKAAMRPGTSRPVETHGD